MSTFIHHCYVIIETTNFKAFYFYMNESIWTYHVCIPVYSDSMGGLQGETNIFARFPTDLSSLCLQLQTPVSPHAAMDGLGLATTAIISQRPPRHWGMENSNAARWRRYWRAYTARKKTRL